MNENSIDPQKKAEAELARDRRIIRDGVSKEALAVLKKRYGYDLPIFHSNDVLTAPVNNDVFLRQALIRDGQRQIISFISTSINPHD